MSKQVKYDFKGSVALVTGAASGMGLATAKAFARSGASVVLADIDLNALQVAVDEIIKNGGKAFPVKCDVSDENQVKSMIDLTLATYGRLDAAFNNAGINTIAIAAADVSMADYHRIISINLNGVWNCMQHELRQMIKQGSGTIVNCSSIGGMTGAQGRAPYSATKHGIVGLTQSAALDYATKGIRVNAVSPGMIETPMADVVTGGKKEMLTEMVKAVPMAKLGRAEDIADAVLWLCSDGSSYVTGEILVVDGGFLVQ
jgi:NAD(P)-dependent dehydrogenase (short-subunit alcohol dehydrogenase family)